MARFRSGRCGRVLHPTVPRARVQASRKPEVLLWNQSSAESNQDHHAPRDEQYLLQQVRGGRSRRCVRVVELQTSSQFKTPDVIAARGCGHQPESRHLVDAGLSAENGDRPIHSEQRLDDSRSDWRTGCEGKRHPFYFRRRVARKARKE